MSSPQFKSLSVSSTISASKNTTTWWYEKQGDIKLHVRWQEWETVTLALQGEAPPIDQYHMKL